MVIDHVCVEHLPWRDLIPGFLTCLCSRKKKTGKGLSADAKDKSSSQEPEEEHPAAGGAAGTATGAGVLRDEDKASNVSMQMV